MRICFIGGGNMASALINGLTRDEHNNAVISMVDPSEQARAAISGSYEVTTHAQLPAAADRAEIIVLAVKPQVMPQVLEQLAEALAGEGGTPPLIVSVAAGITCSQISAGLGLPVPVVRTMPNTPALLGAGITALFANDRCSSQQRNQAEQLMRSAGAVVWVEKEELLDAVTAVSGSGPAYFYLLTEAIQEAGVRQGLDVETARLLATHTAHGAGLMLLEGGADATELRRRVTSPGGTTQAAIESLVQGGFGQLVAEAVQAATRRSRELSGPGGSS